MSLLNDATSPAHAWLALALLLAGTGCGSPPASGTPAAPAAPTTATRVERPELPAGFLDALGKKGWVYKFSGAPALVEFKVYHRPAGKGHKEEVIRLYSNHDSFVGLSQEDGGLTKPTDGLLVALLPNRLSDQGEVQVGFTVAHRSNRMRTSAQEFFPPSVASHTSMAIDDKVAELPAEVPLGKTLELTNLEYILGDTEPFEDREVLRFVITVTPIPDGKLPPRPQPPAEESGQNTPGENGE